MEVEKDGKHVEWDSVEWQSVERKSVEWDGLEKDGIEKEVFGRMDDWQQAVEGLEFSIVVGIPFSQRRITF